jgi:hypothetical protein
MNPRVCKPNAKIDEDGYDKRNATPEVGGTVPKRVPGSNRNAPTVIGASFKMKVTKKRQESIIDLTYCESRFFFSKMMWA